MGAVKSNSANKNADGAIELLAQSQAAVCLMHMQGQPQTMQDNPQYYDVVQEVHQFLAQRFELCVSAGIAPERIILDPGFGFGKTMQHNYELLKHLSTLHELGRPLLVGISRKSMLGAVTGRPVQDRLAASISAAVIAAIKGARIIRVHDVAMACDLTRLFGRTQ